MKYAVVAHSGRQFKVKEGDLLEVDRISDVKIDEEYIFDNVLLVVDGDNAHVGRPHVSGAKVSGKVIAQIKGNKLRIAKYKAKVRYRKVIGFRPQFTQIKVEKISFV